MDERICAGSIEHDFLQILPENALTDHAWHPKSFDAVLLAFHCKDLSWDSGVEPDGGPALSHHTFQQVQICYSVHTVDHTITETATTPAFKYQPARFASEAGILRAAVRCRVTFPVLVTGDVSLAGGAEEAKADMLPSAKPSSRSLIWQDLLVLHVPRHY